VKAVAAGSKWKPTTITESGQVIKKADVDAFLKAHPEFN
jgi:ribose transport system substrate-binding protein